MKNFVTPPLIGSEFINLIKLFQKNKIDRSHIIKALYVASISLLGAPFRAYDKTKLSPEILGRDIKHPPIFIIGHWRSGTTYLHHLMSLDDNLAEMTSFQAFFPGNFLSSEKVWKSIVTPLWISQRPMDNVVYSPNVPEEEEYALGNISNYSFYHGFFFPKNMLDYFNKYVLFEDLGEKEVLKYKIKYMEIVKKLDLYYEQKQLIFKNPTNTARIKILLELFPQAKFIHIYRNPYIVYASIKNFYNKILPSFSFHHIDEKAIELNIFIIYQKLMQTFFDTKDLIPPGNLIEIRYEDFIGNEVELMKDVYQKFDLSNCEASENKIKKYLALNSSYQKNKYSLDKATQKKIYQNWQFTIDTWNYTIEWTVDLSGNKRK